MGWWFGHFMTFEVIADDEQPAIRSILSDASGRLLATSDARDVIGYAAYGQTIGAAVEPLIECFAIDLFDDCARLTSSPGAEALVIATDGGTIELETDAPASVVGAAELAALGSGSATIDVRQVGDAATSRPAQISINI